MRTIRIPPCHSGLHQAESPGLRARARVKKSRGGEIRTRDLLHPKPTRANSNRQQSLNLRRTASVACTSACTSDAEESDRFDLERFAAGLRKRLTEEQLRRLAQLLVG